MRKLLTTISLTAVILAIVLAFGAALTTPTAAEEDQSSERDTTEAKKEETAKTDDEDYQYIAQAGDSYSQIARKAVQTYGIETDGHIGAEGVLFAETNLASAAGWPILNEGQTVTVSKTSVKEWFDKAAQLTAEEKVNWGYYVPYVNFNTNSVGEATEA